MDAPGRDAAVIDTLLPALRRREPVAFHQLYDLMAGPLQAYARARVGDRATAEDVVQEVFLHLTRKVKRFDSNGEGLLAWLYIATRRRCIDVHRRRGRRRETSVAQVPEDPRAGHGAAPSPDIDGLDPALEAALAALTEDQREAVLLRRVAGLGGGEVAAVMGRDREAVYALCARGEARLRALLLPPQPPTTGEDRTAMPSPLDLPAAERPNRDEESR